MARKTHVQNQFVFSHHFFRRTVSFIGIRQNIRLKFGPNDFMYEWNKTQLSHPVFQRFFGSVEACGGGKTQKAERCERTMSASPLLRWSPAPVCYMVMERLGPNLDVILKFTGPGFAVCGKVSLPCLTSVALCLFALPPGVDMRRVSRL